MYSSRLLLNFRARQIAKCLMQNSYFGGLMQHSLVSPDLYISSHVQNETMEGGALNKKFCSAVATRETKQRKLYESKKYFKRSEKHKETIVSKSNNPDIFGDLTDFQNWDVEEENIGEESEFHEDSEVFIPEDRKYRSPNDYLKGMKDLVKEKKLKEALALFLDMRRHHVLPALPHFTFMIGACGRAGYTEMAFKLLRQMTDRGLKPTPATLTGLFNSCAECPSTEYGLRKAHFLKEKIPMKIWDVTPPTYRAMMKAFGKCGDIKTAFETVDEMIEAGFGVTEETYNTLLISCISDKEAGFTHAIEVWRKMVCKRISPSLFSYNLLLRAVRDCGVGQEEVSCNILQHWSSYLPRSSAQKKGKLTREDVLTLPGFPDPTIKLLSSSSTVGKSPQGNSNSRKSEKKEKHFEPKSSVVETSVPLSADNIDSSHNVLSPRPASGVKFIDLTKVNSPADRLLLIGGMKGVLDLMKNNKVTPDIKTFTLLLKSISDSIEDENELLLLMEDYQLKPDVDFFNILIKKRNFRRDFKAAKEVIPLITKKGLSPDIVTFGVLALGCSRRKDGLQLLHDMKILGLCPNIEIFGALLNAARKSVDFEYIAILLKEMKIQRIKPSPKFLQMLENIKSFAQQKLVANEQGKEVEMLSFSEQSYHEFCRYYEQWLKTVVVEEQLDPWLQYKTDIIDRAETERFVNS